MPGRKTWPGLIRSIRKVRRWSQEELAGQLQSDQATISLWERGVVTPGFAAQQRLELLAAEAGLQSLAGIEAVVRASPYPMLLVDSQSTVVSASASSGFQAGMTVGEQTPQDERPHLDRFNAELTAKGFWEAGHAQAADYAFQRGIEVAGAVVVPVVVRGEVFAVVQKR